MDHDLVIDKHLNIYVIFGSIHPPGRVYGYLKYVPSRESSSIWYYRNIPLERIIQRYSVNEVVKTFGEHEILLEYEPAYGVLMPYIDLSNALEYFYPEDRLIEIYYRPRDDLELKIAELIDSIRDHVNIGLREIGVTGSVLGEFYNTKYSDIDLIIYGCRNASKVYEAAENFLKPLTGHELKRYIEGQAELHKLNIEEARDLYRIYRRGLYKDKQVTFVFPRDPCTYPCRIFSKEFQCVTAKIYVEKHQCSALQYPGEAYIEKVLWSDRGYADIKMIISYEGIFSPIIYEGETLLVKGSMRRVYDLSRDENYYAIIVGARECPYMVRRAII